MKQKELLGREIKCPVCGKGFIPHEEWAYKRSNKHMQRRFCSWHCLRKSERSRGTKADRREKLIQAIRDGLTTREIVKLLGEDYSNISYWRDKLREEANNEGSQDFVRQVPDGDQKCLQSDPDQG